MSASVLFDDLFDIHGKGLYKRVLEKCARPDQCYDLDKTHGHILSKLKTSLKRAHAVAPLTGSGMQKLASKLEPLVQKEVEDAHDVFAKKLQFVRQALEAEGHEPHGGSLSRQQVKDIVARHVKRVQANKAKSPGPRPIYGHMLTKAERDNYKHAMQDPRKLLKTLLEEADMEKMAIKHGIAQPKYRAKGRAPSGGSLVGGTPLPMPVPTGSQARLEALPQGNVLSPPGVLLYNFGGKNSGIGATVTGGC